MASKCRHVTSGTFLLEIGSWFADTSPFMGPQVIIEGAIRFPPIIRVLLISHSVLNTIYECQFHITENNTLQMPENFVLLR